MRDFPDIDYDLAIPYRLQTRFTERAFAPDNRILRDLLCARETGARRKALVYLDASVAEAMPGLEAEIRSYFDAHADELRLLAIRRLPGGEASKNDPALLQGLYKDIEDLKVCRHSYILGIGGGALLDTVGFAAATAHRGVRHIRFPTTTLGQADAGVGVKNGINFRGKKNFVGAFAPPFAVVNDFAFLDALPDRHRRNGYIEAVKVAAIRDPALFAWIEERADALARFDSEPLRQLIHRSAALHLRHIATAGDPFETGSARPLDFGHWAAHKLEQLSDFRLSHGEAVAIGVAIDTVYSREAGYLDAASAARMLTLLDKLGFATYADELDRVGTDGRRRVLEGLEEFREHLGGMLTITLLKGIGQGFEVHEMDTDRILQSIDQLR